LPPDYKKDRRIKPEPLNSTPVIIIFDIGRTNKKILLFDENYQIVFQKSDQLAETVDEDGFPCENLESLKNWVAESLKWIFALKQFHIKAINFSAYGASFVYLDENGKPLTPLYNYLKPYPQELTETFYKTYGDVNQFSIQTASPALGSLNSGLQLYRIKNERPEIIQRLKYALHLPQYISYLLTGKCCSDITSIGCHTGLWDFEQNEYHSWLTQENLLIKLAPIKDCSTIYPANFSGKRVTAGIGLHDSSAALIPYLMSFNEPFIMISTGTWCISLNPSNKTPLTLSQLESDCLCYLQHWGNPVKASRLFSGHEHEQQVKRIAAHFGQNVIKFRTMLFNEDITRKLKEIPLTETKPVNLSAGFIFGKRNLADFKNDEEAYHQLILDLINLQKLSTQLIIQDSPVKKIFIDGGFSTNNIYMNLLAAAFPGAGVFSAAMAQSSALGAALAIHGSWNTQPIPHDLIELKYYSTSKAIAQ
jgi:sugar (pentulose or hexulose) kinase